MAPSGVDGGSEGITHHHKRDHSEEAPEGDAASLDVFATPLQRPVLGQPMAAFFEQLRPEIDTALFQRVDSMSDDGLYLHKRHIRGEHGKMLEQAGTVLQHTVVYLKSGEQVTALDFGPVGEADVTANLMESVPCGPVMHEHAEVPNPADDAQCLPFLRIRAPYHPADSPVLAQAVAFAQSREYHAFANNCIQNCDFFVRALTGGAVRGAPLMFDALCGRVPAQDSPMLLMFMLMTRISWFDVCDGSRLAAAFLEQHSTPPVPAVAEEPAAACLPADAHAPGQHADKAAKHAAEQGPETERTQQVHAEEDGNQGGADAGVAAARTPSLPERKKLQPTVAV